MTGGGFVEVLLPDWLKFVVHVIDSKQVSFTEEYVSLPSIRRNAERSIGIANNSCGCAVLGTTGV